MTKATPEGSPLVAPASGNAVYCNRCKASSERRRVLGDMPRDGYDVILFSTAGTHDSSPELVAAALQKMLAKAGI